jgi:arginine/ornithine transport system permease protein
MIEWDVVARAMPQFVQGWYVTLALLVSCLASGLVISIPLSLLRSSNLVWLSGPVALFSFLLRGTPLLVQLLIVYVGLPQFAVVRESLVWPLLRQAWFCAWLTFTLNTTAYTTEIFAGALRATPRGEIEAARAVGMQVLQRARHILIPAALRRALPQYGNEVIGVLHATAIASAVSLVDITLVARDLYANTLLPVEAFGTAAVFYLLTTFIIVRAIRFTEARWFRHLRRDHCQLNTNLNAH